MPVPDSNQIMQLARKIADQPILWDKVVGQVRNPQFLRQLVDSGQIDDLSTVIAGQDPQGFGPEPFGFLAAALVFELVKGARIEKLTRAVGPFLISQPCGEFHWLPVRLQLSDQLLQDRKIHSDTRMRLAIYGDRARSYLLLKCYKDAITECRLGLAARKVLGDDVSDDININTAMTYRLRASAERHLGQLDTAVVDVERAISIFEDLLNRGVSRVKSNLAAAYVERGGVHFQRNSFSDAVKDCEVAINMCLENHDVASTAVLADAYSGLANAKRHLGQFQEAIISASEAIVLYQKLMDEKGEAQFELNLAIACQKRAAALILCGEFMAAVADCEKAVTICHRIVYDRDRSECIDDLALAHMHCGQAYFAQGRLMEAMAETERAIQLFEQLVNDGRNELREDLDTAIQHKESIITRHDARAISLSHESDMMMPRLCQVSAGKFIMGRDPERPSSWIRRWFSKQFTQESPPRSIYVSEFYIDETPVTCAQYSLFMRWMCETNDHSFCHPDEPQNKDHSPLITDQELFLNEEQPITGIDWYDAYSFAAWAGMRLPTEAEWEKAARGTDGRLWPWGNQPGLALGKLQAWYHDDGTVCKHPRLAHVFDYPDGESPYGCLGMAGNVWEYCLDYYDEHWYEQMPQRNPVNKTPAQQVVARGGCFTFNEHDAMCAIRIGIKKDVKIPACLPKLFRKSIPVFGFRCASDSPNPVGAIGAMRQVKAVDRFE